MDTHAYLNRVAYHGPVAPTLETLRALHYAHLLAVPFENLDIPERPIVLDEGRFFEKIVRQRRGGFCYELNGLFAALLRELGFRVTLLSARVAKENKGSPLVEFDHLAIRVDLDEPWLADIGFGESFIEPLPLASGAERTERGVTFRLECGDDGRWKVMARRGQNGNGWKMWYDFSLVPRQLAEFAGMCRWHQTSPDSAFMQRKICTRLTPTGRVTLANLRLIVTENGAKQERTLQNDGEYRAALREHFGIELSQDPPQRRGDNEESKSPASL